jgi:hypothetical protein
MNNSLKYKEMYREKLSKIIEDFRYDEVRKALHEVIKNKTYEKSKDIVADFLKEINFFKKLSSHPVFANLIRRGTIGTISDKVLKKSVEYRLLREKITEITKKSIEDPETENIIAKIMQLLRRLREIVINYFLEIVGEEEMGLRHLHAPGSVARKEGRNLYFGEKYNQEVLYKLASRICDSIALGDNIGIYSENENLMLILKQMVLKKFNFSYKIEASEDEKAVLNKDEANYPYATLLAFILWLVDTAEGEANDQKELLYSLIESIKSSPIQIIFVPRDKPEKWTTINLPRLDMFIDKWIINKEARYELKAFRNEIARFVVDARKAARRKGKRAEADKSIELLMNYYEMIIQSLIVNGSVDLYAFRRLIDLIIEISNKYDVRTYLKPLSLVEKVG